MLFFAAKPDIVIEAAGQATLSQYGIEILEKGIDLLVSSIGLFTNDDILNKFITAAEQSGAEILLSAGALPALDWIGLDISIVIIRSKKCAYYSRKACHIMEKHTSRRIDRP